MPDSHSIGLFVIAALVLLVTPGPVTLYIIARSVEQGRRAGVVSALGAGAGTLCHMLAAAMGLSALLAASPVAFLAVRYLGAAYLVYLGVRALFSPPADAAEAPRRALHRTFGQAALVNLLNPKTGLFFLAFLPQFIDAIRGPVAAQVLFFGCLLVTMGFVTDSSYALAAGTAAGFLRRSPRVSRGLGYASAVTYLVLGVLAALGPAAHGK